MNARMTVIVSPATGKEMPATLASLEIADRADLLDLWGSLVGSSAPKNLSARV